MENKALFSQEQKQAFIKSVKTSSKKRTDILNNGMKLRNAFIFGYLDVSRAPLRGIGGFVGNSVEVRGKCIDDIIEPFCRERIFNAKSIAEFDEKHEEMCEKIKTYYASQGYSAFTVGKAQKWINMAIKYACIYDKDDAAELGKIFSYCHIPIDRYVSNSIVKLNVTLPEYDGFVMSKFNGEFDAEKSNYSWSKIDNYNVYLTCQKDIRKALRNKNVTIPLQWEYDEWLKANDAKENKNWQ